MTVVMICPKVRGSLTCMFVSHYSNTESFGHKWMNVVQSPLIKLNVVKIARGNKARVYDKVLSRTQKRPAKRKSKVDYGGMLH